MMNPGYYSDDDNSVTLIDPNNKAKRGGKDPEVKVCSLPVEQNVFLASSDDDDDGGDDLYDLSIRRGYQIEGKPKKESNLSNVGYRVAKFKYDSDEDDENEVNDSHYKKPTHQKVAERGESPPRQATPHVDRGSGVKQTPQPTTVDKNSNRFLITVVNKRARNGEKPHPWEHRITETELCFAINGIRGKTVFLRRGNTYYFEIKQKPDKKGHLSQYMYFTTDPMGGVAGDHSDNPAFDPSPMEGSPDPTANGVVCLKITNKTPKLFYYQSKTYQMLGGPIVVKD